MGSRSRGSSPERKRKHKRHHRHRKSRSRSSSSSRSQSRERGASRIHVNPKFGIHRSSNSHTSHPQFGVQTPPAPIVQNSRFLEMEVNRLNQQLIAEQNNMYMTQQRMNGLTQDLRVLSAQKVNMERRCFELSHEKGQLMEANNSMRLTIERLEESNKFMETSQLESIGKMEAKEEEIRNLAYQVDVIKQQTEGLNERNAELKTKCEVLVAKNRETHNEINTAKQVAEQSKLNAQKFEVDLKFSKVEILRLMKEVEGVKEKEKLWNNEKKSLECAIVKKNDDVRISETKSKQALDEANKHIKKLELRLKNEKPMYQNELATEAIYQTIETIKKTYTTQLNRLAEEIEIMKKQKENEQKVDELPHYLKTPQKPKRNHEVSISERIIKRPLRANSGPPVESPMNWQKRRCFEDKGDDGEDEDDRIRVRRIQSPAMVKRREEAEEHEDSFNETGISEYEEDDLLAGGEGECFENMELVEKQIFGDSI